VFRANGWRLLGVDRATVIEEVDFDEESDTVGLCAPRRVHQVSLWSLRRGLSSCWRGSI
jgi:hypothetical protein